MNKKPRTGLIISTALLVLGVLLTWLCWPRRTVTLSQLASLVDQGQVSKVEIQGNEVEASISGRIVVAYKENEVSFIESMKLLGLKEDQLKTIDIRVNPEVKFWGPALTWLAIVVGVFLALLGVIRAWFMMLERRQTSGLQSGKDAASFEFELAGDTKTGFGDIAGYEDVRQQVKVIVEYFQSPKAFADLRAAPPKNVLLVGPPGTGKTQLARVVAKTARVSFIPVSGSTFVELFVGVGSKRVRDLFEAAKKKRPTIIFVDEIDAVARRRATTSFQSNMEHDHTLNEFLNQLDGFNQLNDIIFMCATNREDILDPALLQRMNLRIEVGLPKLADRKKILNLAISRNEIEGWNEAVLNDIAIRTVGFSGRQLRNLVSEAGWDCYKRLHSSARERCRNGDLLMTVPVSNTQSVSPIAFAGTCDPRNEVKLTVSGNREITLMPEEGIWSHVAGLPDGKIIAISEEVDGNNTVVRESAVTFQVRGQGRVNAADVTAALGRVGVVIPQIENREHLERCIGQNVIEQEHAIATLVTIAASHYTRARADVDIELISKSKSSVLLVGPSGCGKTTLVRALAKQLGVPFATLSASAFLDWRNAASAVDQLLRQLVRVASGAHNKASYGIACIENVQVLGRTDDTENRLAGQRLLGQLIRGDVVELALSRNLINPQEISFDTSNLLIVLEGHFSQFEDIILHDYGDTTGVVLDRFAVNEFAEELGLDRIVLNELVAVVHFNPLAVSSFLEFLNSHPGRTMFDRLSRPASTRGVSARLSLSAMEELAVQAQQLSEGYRGLEGLLEAVLVHAANTSTPGSVVEIDSSLVQKAVKATTFGLRSGGERTNGLTLEERIVNKLKDILDAESSKGLGR